MPESPFRGAGQARVPAGIGPPASRRPGSRSGGTSADRTPGLVFCGRKDRGRTTAAHGRAAEKRRGSLRSFPSSNCNRTLVFFWASFSRLSGRRPAQPHYRWGRSARHLPQLVARLTQKPDGRSASFGKGRKIESFALFWYNLTAKPGTRGNDPQPSRCGLFIWGREGCKKVKERFRFGYDAALGKGLFAGPA